MSENHKIWNNYVAKLAYAIRSPKHDVASNFDIFGREIYLNNLEGSRVAIHKKVTSQTDKRTKKNF